jgi:hypothetical protein
MDKKGISPWKSQQFFNVITFIASFLRGATQGNMTSQRERTVPEMTHAQPRLPSPTADPHSQDCYMNTSYSMHNTQSRLAVNDNDVVTSIATIRTFEAVFFCCCNFYHSTRTSFMKGAVRESFVTKQARKATVMWPSSRSPWGIKSSVACSNSGASLVHRSIRGLLAGDGRENSCRRILVEARGEWTCSVGRRQ